jgi:phage host-nuclease inhibitor protein Gam
MEVLNEVGRHSRIEASVECESRVRAEELLGEIADAARARDLLNARMGQVMARLRARFEPQLQRCESEIKAKTEAVQEWAKANRGEEFGERQSIETAHGVVGFRKTGWSLRLLGKETWETVTQRIRKSKVWRKLYLRIKYEPDRRQMLTDLGKEKLSESEARKIGVERWQEESCFLVL